MHHLGAEMCTFLCQSGVLWDLKQMPYVICKIDQLKTRGTKSWEILAKEDLCISEQFKAYGK